ncbi:Xanthine dehydrogenase, partial [Pseudocercospora fuligena]
MAPGLVEPQPAVEPVQQHSLSSVTQRYDDCLRFYLNGTKVVLDEADPEVTLLEYLRGVGLTGTKLGCAEGGCGACTVVVSQYNPTTKKIYHASINACIAPLVSVDGKHVITVEGIGSVKKPHPAQERIAKGNGSQCGFCTPGIVMSLYALLRNTDAPSEHEVEEAFDGNLCRCTGYRPILDAAQSFSADKGCAKAKTNGGSGCCMEKSGVNGKSGCCQNGVKDDQPIKRFTPPGFIEYKPDTELIFPPALRRHEYKPLAFGNKRKRWYRPVTLQQLLEIKSVYPSAKIIGGSTETQIEVKFKAMQYTVSVFVGDIPELRQYKFEEDLIEIGGNVTLTDLEYLSLEAAEHYGLERGQPFMAINKQIRYFAGRQIRNAGTPAGNLATASPISDLNPVLLATNATIVAKKGEYMRAYKQAKRKDDDIAIVNAALRVHLDEGNVVKNSSLVYGGLAPVTIGAKKAMTYLVGKKFTEPSTLEGVMNALEEDFDLRFGVPGGRATYRKTLALGFFYKFYHEVLSALNPEGTEIDQDCLDEIEREISKGHKDHTVGQAYEKKILGKETPHVAALKQCTGEAQYTDDIPVQKNELYGCMVLSTKAHARILSIDASPALDLPGVYDYVDHRDLPNAQANFWGAPNCDETFFAVDEVFCAGQPIGLVLATSAKRAEAGARAVKVEYEDLPALFTMEEAIAADSFFPHYHYINNGDVKEACAKADHVFSGVARMGGQEHFYLETNACVAVPKPEDGEMEIFSSTQNPTETQAYVAQVTGVSANKIVSRVKRLGGGFGGKETRSIQLAGICAIAAKKTQRPVRAMLNRDEDIATSGQRHPFLGHWKVAVNKDGKLQALDADIYNNGGWSQDLSAAVVDRALSHVDGCYNIPNVSVRGRICKTNTVSNTAFRGFGGPQGIKWKKRGLSIIPTKFGISFTALFLNQAGALVHIYHDGSVLVAHGGTEMGQGLHTKVTALAAEALGVPLSSVFISETATNTVANTSSTAASASSDLNGYAVWNACQQINERLAPYREKLGKDATMKEIAHAAYFDRVNLSANGFYKTPDIGYVWGPNTGQMFFYFTQGVSAAEVEVDTLTGDWTCRRADIKMDVGRSINPAIDYGQIEGAFVQGMGLFTMEESLWHRASGQIFTRGPGAYKIPGFRDIPQEFNVKLLKDVNWENLRTIQRSRGVGEPPLFMGSAVFFAIRDALKAARMQYGKEEVLSLVSPATVERIRVSCADPILQRAEVRPQE